MKKCILTTVSIMLFITPIDVIAQIDYSENSLFTGSQNISITLYNVKNSNASIPIYLQYNSSGIKVEEESSNIGLGWTLNTGGEIKRIVRGIPDDYFMNDRNNMGVGWIHKLNQTEEWTTELFGYTLWSTTIYEFNYYVNDFIDKFNPEDYSPLGIWKLLRLITDYWLDTQPDIFQFSIPGFSGNFYFNKEGEIVTDSGNKLKFNYTLGGDKRISEFAIIDDNGNQYIFADVDMKSITYDNKGDYVFTYGQSMVPFKSSNFTTSFNDTWHLSKVKSNLMQELIYTYEDDYFENYPIIPSSKYGIEANEKKDFTSYVEKVYTKRIVSISTDVFDLIFTKGNSRQDLYLLTDKKSYAISELKYFEKGSSQITKGFKFNQDYFLTNDNTPSGKRLKLVSIEEYGQDIKLPPRKFFYNENDKLPPKNSTEQDLWGYYNKNNSLTLIPQIYIYSDHQHHRYRVVPKNNYNPNNYYIIAGANRQPDIRIVDGKIETVMDANILQEIELPEGGLLKYEFEPHEYLYENELYRGGGLRVKRVYYKKERSSSNDELVKEFIYKEPGNVSSGRLVNIPIYAYTFIKKSDADIQHKVYDVYSDSKSDYLNKYIKVTSHQNNFFVDQPITYNNVEVKESGNGSIRYTFINNNLFSNHSTDFKSKSHHNLISDWDPVRVWTCEGELCCFYDDVPFPDFNNDCFPFPSNENCNWDRGQISKIEVFSDNGSFLKTDEFTYSYYFENGTSQPDYTYGLVYNIFYHPLMDRECYEYFGFLGHVCPDCDYGNPQYVYGRYRLVSGVSKLLSNKIEKTYDPNDNTKYSTLIVNYDYNHRSQLISEEFINNQGVKIETKYNYINDYFPLVMNEEPTLYHDESILYKMYLKNQIANPIEIINFKDDNIIGGNFIKYDVYPYVQNYSQITDNHIILPKTQYDLDIKNPLSENVFQESRIIYQTSTQIDPNYKAKFNFDNYDSKGNLLQFHPTNGINTSYLYGYNQTLPIAEVKNAKVDEIYFNGYEEGTGLYTTDAHSGKSCVSINTSSQYAGNFIFSKSSLTSGKYVYSAWVKTSGNATLVVKDKIDGNPWLSQGSGNTNGVWKYVELVADINSSAFTGCTQVAIEIYNPNSTPALIDDVRFRPLNSQMTTYTYKPLVGMTSATDNNNRTTYYSYDSFGRLQNVKDEDGYILNQYEYRYYVLDLNLNKTALGSSSYSFSVGGADFVGTNYTYDWDYGDGVVVTNSTQWTTTHNYPSSTTANYTVTVKVYFGGSLVKTLTTTASCLGTVVLNASNISGCSWTFTISGTGFVGSNYTYEWDYGDGYGVQANPNWSTSYFYDIQGTFNVSVKIKLDGVVVRTLYVNTDCTDGGLPV